MEDTENITVARENDQDSKYVDPQEIKCTATASEPVDGTDTTGSEPNEENKEEKVETKPEANDGETCERGGGVTENINTLREEEKETAVEKKEEVKEQTVKEQNNETGVNRERNEGNNESLTKENHINKADDICEEEGKLKEKNKGDEQGHSSESQTEQQTEDKDKKEIKENKDHVQDKERNPARKSGTTSSSALRAPIKSSVCPRAARPSARRDAMAKFQKDQTPGVRNFKVQQTSTGMAGGASIKQKILQWCRNKTQTYEGVNIENFSSSWSDGLAFCALVHHFFPDAFDFSSLKASEREKNFTLAFSTAESLADCCPLLDVSDMLLMGKNPDPMCVFTYVQALCHHLSKIDKERKDKEKKENKNKEDDQDVAEVHEQEDKEKDESEQHEENQTDSSMKSVEETDQNENVINTDAVNDV
ncbi:smoothelin-like 1 [Triplophysa rosa]|uniref:Smoothelin-like 1 n=1 Tax=Triplophysa rosa TaxID=992332 RepID=A0A9W7TTX3_TRIRA|nr:smoothelin-like 1 [Triplophysa rosa]KAI7801954.1 smoothelin-like 1 [Triplophysa rosa]